MSVNSNFRKDKCWSCEFFSGKREYKKGAFLGGSVSADGRGKCTNKRSSEFNRDVDENRWCSKYQKWGVLQSALAVEEQKKETQRIKNELMRQQQSSGGVTESQHSTVSHIDRTAIKIDHEAEKQRIEERQKAKELKGIKNSPLVGGIVSAAITLFTFLLGWIPCWYWNYKLKSDRSMIEQLMKWGHDPKEAIVVELYNDGLHAKQMRDSVIWIPFVILLIGITLTVILVILLSKKKRAKLSNN